MAALDIIALDTATPQLRVPGTGDTFNAPRKVAIAPEANSNALAVTGYSLTGSNASSLLDLAGTWNTSGTPTALKLNVTDTASNASSLLMDLQVGGTSRFSVNKSGAASFSSGSISAGGLRFGNNAEGFYAINSGVAYSVPNSTSVFAARYGNGAWGLGIGRDSLIGWGAQFDATSGHDLLIGRDAANTLAQRNGTNAQTFRLYNTYTDASNYERAALTWSSNVAYLRAQNAGTGSARLMVPVTGSTTVAGLPAAATAGAGARAFVTDANATTYLSTVAGGGANAVPVVSDGTNWLIG